MMKLTKEEVQKRRANISPVLTQTSKSAQLVDELRNIGEHHDLHIDQLGTLADAVELVLAGVVLTREFVALLLESLPDLGKDKVMAIAEEVNRTIFGPVREALYKVERGASEPASPTESVPVETLKSTVATSNVNQVSDISHENRDARVKMIPQDITSVINSDPYKEPLD